jgi:hypothetical protein
MMAASALETTPESERAKLAQVVAGVDPSAPGATQQPAPKVETPAAQDDQEATDESDNPPDAEGVVMSPTTAPPAGVLIPGAQPTDNLYFTRAKAIVEAHLPLFTDALERKLGLEQDRVLSAAKKERENFGQWADQFYQQHAPHVRSAIGPVMQALAESLLSLRGITATDEVRSNVNKGVDEIVARHVEASRNDVMESDGIEQRVAGWKEYRAAPFARHEMERLVELFKPEVKP